MVFVLVLLIGGFAVAAAIALFRGLKAFMQDGDQLQRPGATLREGFGVQQNRMMTQRVMFQGIAIVLIALIGVVAGSK